MAFYVNLALVVDFLLLFLVTYRISWATGPYARLSAEQLIVKRHTLWAYYTGLVLQFLAALSAGAHVLIRNVLATGAGASPYFGVLAGGLFVVAVGIGVRYGRFGDGPLEEGPGER